MRGDKTSHKAAKSMKKTRVKILKKFSFGGMWSGKKLIADNSTKNSATHNINIWSVIKQANKEIGASNKCW